MRINARQATALAPDWQQRFAASLQRLRERYRLLEEPAFVLPLLADESGRWVAQVLNEQGRTLEMRYDERTGLAW
ncbi:hypothetical protein D3C77_751610 [compost metagenome]